MPTHSTRLPTEQRVAQLDHRQVPVSVRGVEPETQRAVLIAMGDDVEIADGLRDIGRDPAPQIDQCCSQSRVASFRYSLLRADVFAAGEFTFYKPSWIAAGCPLIWLKF